MEIRIQKDDLSLGEKLDSLPGKPGVYQFKNADAKVIYVGKAQNLRSRVRQYFSARGGSPPANMSSMRRAGASGGQKSRGLDAKLEALVAKIADVELIVTDSEVEALILEANLVKKLKPRYNVLLKDDKSFPYI
ncbi:MAG: GIY-YIG nuclease family protein, partial [Ignavibacteriales bacterium]|nr:GIY-YIG nuclease family protein [Ignavibacteriales bacterium]